MKIELSESEISLISFCLGVACAKSDFSNEGHKTVRKIIKIFEDTINIEKGLVKR